LVKEISKKGYYGKVKLIIAEKDSVARRIAQILSENKAKTSKEGGISVYRWDDCICMGLRGHIVKLDFPKRYSNWNAVRPEELINAKPEHTVTEGRTAEALKRLAKEADEIVIATDFDREGELIGREAVDLIDGKFKVSRVRFSSLVDEEIKKAFEEPTYLDQNLADAAETRQWIDLIWGAVLTRQISISSHSVGKNFLSVGRVQTPTLARIVEQEKKIASFVPQRYWKIICTLRKGESTFQATREVIWDEAEAKSVFDRIRNEKNAITKGFSKGAVKKRRPVPFDTTEFLRCTNFIHMTPARAMNIAETLYAHGYISYPRTDNTVYPRGLNLKTIVGKLAAINEMKETSEFLVREGITPSRGRNESKDHPPIYPTGILPKKLDKYSSAVYELIVRRFLATLHRDAEVEKKSAVFDIKDETFSAEGQRLVYAGYMQVWTYEKFVEKIIPDLGEGERVLIEGFELIEEKTKPPARLPLGSLIALMEKLGLGTKSTRAEIVQKLYDREYIKDNPPVSTDIANTLIEALERYAGEITREDMTKKLEEDMERIASGDKKFTEVVDESRDMLAGISKVIEAHSSEIGKEILKAEENSNFAGVCPKCGSKLRVLTSKKKKRFIACSGYPKCRNTYPLPQKGNVKFEGGCDKCGAPVISFYAGRRKVRGCANPECDKTVFKYGKKQEKQIAPETR
jgi:DNA topoisomerase-1